MISVFSLYGIPRADLSCFCLHTGSLELMNNLYKALVDQAKTAQKAKKLLTLEFKDRFAMDLGVSHPAHASQSRLACLHALCSVFEMTL
jgi:hypothetical protein